MKAYRLRPEIAEVIENFNAAAKQAFFEEYDIEPPRLNPLRQTGLVLQYALYSLFYWPLVALITLVFTLALAFLNAYHDARAQVEDKYLPEYTKEDEP